MTRRGRRKGRARPVAAATIARIQLGRVAAPLASIYQLHRAHLCPTQRVALAVFEEQLQPALPARSRQPRAADPRQDVSCHRMVALQPLLLPTLFRQLTNRARCCCVSKRSHRAGHPLEMESPGDERLRSAKCSATTSPPPHRIAEESLLEYVFIRTPFVHFTPHYCQPVSNIDKEVLQFCLELYNNN